MPILSAIYSAALIVNSSLRVLDENKMMQNMQAADMTFYYDNSDGLKIVFKDKSNEEKLQSILRKMEKGSSIFRSDFMTLKLDNTTERRIIHIIGVPNYFAETQTDPDGHKSAFLLVWRRLLAERQINFDALKREYRLSPAEALVAHAVGYGQSTEEFALQRGISKVTARNQLRHACIKLGVSRQAEIAVLLAEIGAFSPLLNFNFNTKKTSETPQENSVSFPITESNELTALES